MSAPRSFAPPPASTSCTCRLRTCWSGSPTSARSLCSCSRSNSTPTCAGNWRASAACCAAPASRPIEKLRAPMKVIAIEEHFITPMYREKVGANEFRNFYLKSRGEQLGHDIVEQNSDLGAGRLAHMDAAGVDVQVLSFGSPGPQAFAAEVAIPMARDANDRLYQAIQRNPARFAGFAALAPADPAAAAQELQRCVSNHGLKGAMIHGQTHARRLQQGKAGALSQRAQE